MGWLWWLGLVGVGVLILIPVAMAARVTFGILSAAIEHRRALRHRVECDVPGLGRFHTTDGALWSREGVDCAITVPGDHQQPHAEHIESARSLLAQLPGLVAKASSYVSTSEPAPPARWEAIGLEVNPDGTYDISLCNATEPDGVWTVRFRDKQPVEHWFDH